MRSIVVVAAIVIVIGASLLAPGAAGASGRGIDLQEAFDPLGPEVHTLTMPSGRVVPYIDEGEPGWTPIVFLGGHGTAVRVFNLTEFARTSREALRLRVVSVERNGFGESAFDPSLGYEDYVDEVLAVLDHLEIDEFSIMAISGGGPYAAHLAERVPDRVRSLHIAAASAAALPGAAATPICDLDDAALREALLPYSQNPKLWWGMPADSPVHRIPGWQPSAYEDAGRAFFVGGQLGAPDALAHERRLYCSLEEADLSAVDAPAHLYWGSEDTAVPVEQMALWREALPSVAVERLYAGEGHDVQYRHWDQILVDMAGMADKTVLCRRGRTRLVPAERAERLLARGATLGLCAWAT